MSLDRTPAHLTDMLGFVRELRAIAASRSLEAFVADRILNLATEKLFINLGEAAQRIAEAERASIGTVPWRRIIGLRNILAHGYERIDQETLYRTMADDLPTVETALAAALAARDRD
ncbi:MAG: DUF86 domain-containing protein [Rubrivivax sp.]|nr:DUF86 domain-containing protein [Pseudomonadota bacterium]MCW5640363.1 DUF86 domain-containing protein [Rubrivivax sp.]HOW47526.1 DUF86 domain-containing protein [Rubrivivax sp.]HRY87586.1 DUF86 domain-containing protein [Rubrivivax sp.]